MDRSRPPVMRDQFRRELRARLMQEAPIYLTPRHDNAWTTIFGSRLLRPALAAGIGTFVLVVSAGTVSAGSLPGDPAFGVKRAIEDMQVTITFDEVQRVQLLSQIADRRLQELQQIANKDDGQQNNKDDKQVTASTEFVQAVERFRSAADQVQTVAPPAAAQQVQQIVETAREQHGQVIDELQQKVSADKAKDNLDKARDEEDKNTKEEQKGQQGQNTQGGQSPDPKKTPRPTRTPSPSRSPRPTETQRATSAPRATTTDRGNNGSNEDEHTDTPRPSAPRTATPRPPASR
jgi:hypothetical protein